ncbi:MAG TPA: MBL fold metallo-hydrolase, partial [Candidatus Saccharimonadales bacterium]|nr:MBL fold metallo-hydrolase [Candidatus Saccharimonadales bacterium]
MWFILAALVFVAGVAAFLRFYPSFGGRSVRAQWASSANFKKRIFVNQITTPMDMSPRDMVSMLRETMRRGTLRRPVKMLTPEKVRLDAFLAAKEPQLVWLGHSASLIRLEGKTLLLDPMLSKAASPVQFAGPKRFSKPPISAEELPHIDAVLISHDHYDHLDYETIKKLRAKTTKFFVPLGVAAHLQRWGVQTSQIVELDWWDSAPFEGLTLACTPARHFSGRGLNDRFKTLWCSWVIESPGTKTKLFFSGDTGYGPHFKQIGKKYGPFDLTLLECGQYDKRWANIHMQPEQTFTAFQDLRGKRLMPLHWGAFSLALHSWVDSVERV